MLSKRSLGGLLLFAMIVLSILAEVGGAGAHPVGWTLMLLSGCCGWLAALLLLPQVRRSQLVLISVLLLAGIALMLFSWTRSGQFDWHRMISINASLLSMIISVGFLQCWSLIDCPLTGH